jgi:SagB-type dehydrogenase family enzyme
MPKLVLIALPLLLFIAYVVAATLFGKPPSRQAANVASALLLVLYFFATAALGIFWVARQELPVFDWHYLFGYATLALVLLHLAFNLRVATRFLRARFAHGRSKPPAAGARAGWAGTLLGLVGVGAFSFWLGYRTGSDRIVVEWPAEVSRGREGDRSEEAPVQGPSAALQAEDDTNVTAAGRAVEEALWKLVLTYHERASFSELRSLSRSANPYWGVPQRPHKKYADAAAVSLSDPASSPRVRLDRVFAGGAPASVVKPAIELHDLGVLLHHTSGVTAVRGGFQLRAAASSGGLFPVELYVAARAVQDLEEGLYHYHAGKSRLERIDEDRSGETLFERLAWSAGDSRILEAPATVILTVVVSRSASKYGDRSYRYALLDAGHAAANLLVAARALELRADLLGRFDDREVNRLLGLDAHEFALLVIPLGGGSRGSAEAGEEPRFAALGVEGAPRETGIVGLAHAATSLVREEGATEGGRAPRRLASEEVRWGSVMALPTPAPASGDAFETIRRRRSMRRYSDEALPLEALSGVLRDAAGAAPILADSRGGTDAPSWSVEDACAVRCYVVINAVHGLPQGLYVYAPLEHALVPLRTGSLREEAHVATLRQEVTKQAAVVFVFTAIVDTFLERSGARGYRYALLDSGHVAGRIYLAATARGIGVCSVGAFFDPETQNLLGIPAREEITLHTTALGTLPR